MIATEARGAWSEIEQRLRPYVARRVASAVDVDDVLQEIFMRMHRGLDTLDDNERFGGWVYRIAKNAIADRARALARDKLIPVAALPEEPPVADDDDSADLEAELVGCVALFISRLPTPYRETVTLTELEGLTQKQAADMLGITLSGAKSRVQRGRQKLREMFDACCRISVDGRGRVVECEPRDIDDVEEPCRGAAMAWAERGSVE